MQLTNKTILLISPEPWGQNHISKHHYARALAALGNRVYFVNPPTSADKVTTIDEGLFVVDYRLRFRGADRLPAIFRRTIHAYHARILKRLIGHDFDLVWSFDPFRFYDLNWFGKKAVKLYYIADLYQAKFEEKLVKNVDLVISVSQPLLERYKHISTPQLLVNHAIAQYFVQDVDEKYWTTKGDYTPNNPIICGYVGNLRSHYLDIPSFRVIIEQHPTIRFVLIGPNKKDNNLGTAEGAELEAFIDFLETAPNVHLAGSMPPPQLAHAIHEMDMFLICYDADKYPDAVSNSHKILEYLSTGRVVVANKTSSYSDKEALLAMADKNAELPTLFARTVETLSMENHISKAKMRIEFTNENTYLCQIKRIENSLSKLI